MTVLQRLNKAFELHRQYKRGYRDGAVDARETLQPVLHTLAKENLRMSKLLESIGLKGLTDEQVEEAKKMISG